MVCSRTWALCLENEWMWLIPQTETDSNRATEQEERALVMWLLMGVYCKSPPFGSGVCVFFFRGVCSFGRCCFFLIPEAVRLFKTRQQRGLAFSPCQIKDKTKALISLMPTPTSRPQVFARWSQTDRHVCICSISALHCCLSVWLDYAAKSSKLILQMWHEIPANQTSHY